MNNADLLEELLSTPRRHGSAGERAVGRMLVKKFGFREYQDDKKSALAYVKAVGENPTTLWSGHIDTAHAASADKMVQKIYFDAREDMLAFSVCDDPLGADNGAGVWLLLEMIQAGVPGTYILHRGEECGGIGSDGMAQHWKELLSKHTHAIAFDRRGTSDVITHQMVGRCCSDAFAQQLCRLLDMDYEPCDKGTFTDTANYIELIPECTNVSVGYQHEHSSRETLDLEHLANLRDRVIEVFKSPPGLIVVRKVTDVDEDDWYSYRYGSSFVLGESSGFEWDPEALEAEDVDVFDYDELYECVKRDPQGYALLLRRLAREAIDLRSQVVELEQILDDDYKLGNPAGSKVDDDEDDGLGFEQRRERYDG